MLTVALAFLARCELSSKLIEGGAVGLTGVETRLLAKDWELERCASFGRPLKDSWRARGGRKGLGEVGGDIKDGAA